MLVILAGFGLLSFIHKDIHTMAVRLVEHLHFNPAKHYPRIFLDATERVTDSELWALASAALIYSGVRFFEAAGLWFGKKWAEWFGVLTGGMYIPVELYEVIRSVSWPKVILLPATLASWHICSMRLAGRITNGQQLYSRQTDNLDETEPAVHANGIASSLPRREF